MSAEPIVPHAYGAAALSVGSERASIRPRTFRVRHCFNGDVVIRLPSDGRLSASDAKRLAWGLLADLAPDEAFAVPEVVSYREGTRLEIMRHLATGPKSYSELCQLTGWARRPVERRVKELEGDGRVRRAKKGPRGVVLWGLALGAAELPEGESFGDTYRRKRRVAA